jgi:hypothetical protein
MEGIIVSDDIFDEPGSGSSGDNFTPDDLSGRLLLVKPLDHRHGINTAFGEKEAIEADVHVLDGGDAGSVLRAVYVFPLALIGQLKGNVATGRFCLGRLGKGTPKPGQKPPWRLLDPTEDDKTLARKYVASDKFKVNDKPAAPAKPAADPWGSADDTPPF